MSRSRSSREREVIIYCDEPSHDGHTVLIARWSAHRFPPSDKWYVSLESRLDEDENVTRTTVIDGHRIDHELVWGTSTTPPPEKYFNRLSDSHETYDLKCFRCGLHWSRKTAKANAVGLALIEHGVQRVSLGYLVKDHTD